jgi:hypothetical protein
MTNTQWYNIYPGLAGSQISWWMDYQTVSTHPIVFNFRCDKGFIAPIAKNTAMAGFCYLTEGTPIDLWDYVKFVRIEYMRIMYSGTNALQWQIVKLPNQATWPSGDNKPHPSDWMGPSGDETKAPTNWIEWNVQSPTSASGMGYEFEAVTRTKPVLKIGYLTSGESIALMNQHGQVPQNPSWFYVLCTGTVVWRTPSDKDVLIADIDNFDISDIEASAMAWPLLWDDTRYDRLKRPH